MGFNLRFDGFEDDFVFRFLREVTQCLGDLSCRTSERCIKLRAQPAIKCCSMPLCFISILHNSNTPPPPQPNTGSLRPIALLLTRDPIQVRAVTIPYSDVVHKLAPRPFFNLLQKLRGRPRFLHSNFYRTTSTTVPTAKQLPITMFSRVSSLFVAVLFFTTFTAAQVNHCGSGRL